MSTSTKTTESRYPARSRVAPERAPVDPDQPTSVTSRDMVNVGQPRKTRHQQQQQPRRIPALTTSRTFGEKSPIVHADIQSFLAKCMAISQWEGYTEKEKFMIIESLPQTRRPLRGVPYAEDTSREAGGNSSGKTIDEAHTSSRQHRDQDWASYMAPPLEPTFCLDDPYLKRSIARFKRELSDGYYTKVWQDKAKRAHEERMEGKFDEYLAEHAEEMFVEEEGEAEEAGAHELGLESEDGEYLEGGARMGRKAKARRDR